MSSWNAVRGRHGLVPQGLSLILSALLVLSPGSGLVAANGDDAAATTAGTLSIASDPAGANVYVDGRFVGATPISVERLPAGDHRVRLVKAGYLENGRIVSVKGDRASALEVKLTPDAGASTAGQVITGGGGGGGISPWVWIGLAGGGAAAAALVLMNRNSPPTAGSVNATPSTGLQASTSFSFTAQGASDPDGDPLTYAWEFGDGTNDRGQSVTKTYNTSGTFTVTVRVSDGKKDATATGTVTVRSLTGSWRGTSPFYGVTTATLTQSGSSVTGNWVDEVPPAGTVTGSVTGAAPRVRLNINFAGFPGVYNADPSADINRLSGNYSDLGGQTSFSLTRQ